MASQVVRDHVYIPERRQMTTGRPGHNERVHIDLAPLEPRLNYRRMLVIALCTAAGLASVAIADVASRRGYSYNEASIFFWLGLLIIFVPIAAGSLSKDVNHHERLLLIILLGVAFYIVKVIASP